MMFVDVGSCLIMVNPFKQLAKSTNHKLIQVGTSITIRAGDLNLGAALRVRPELEQEPSTVDS